MRYVHIFVVVSSYRVANARLATYQIAGETALPPSDAATLRAATSLNPSGHTLVEPADTKNIDTTQAAPTNQTSERSDARFITYNTPCSTRMMTKVIASQLIHVIEPPACPATTTAAVNIASASHAF